jgi:hypothetical protein
MPPARRKRLTWADASQKNSRSQPNLMGERLFLPKAVLLRRGLLALKLKPG